jgi:hypothetical protein
MSTPTTTSPPESFSLEWFGGPAERHFRKLRPGVDELPWGTLPVSEYPPLLVDRARIAWTEAAYNEYCTAVAFSQMLHALLLAKAPIDLVGMASDFVADEILHIELTSRVAMELGGGAPYTFEPHLLSQSLPEGLTPLQRANDLVVRVCCVGEAFSLPMLAGCMGAAAHPLTRAILQRIVKDESPHGRFGWLYLDWADDQLDDAERERLAGVALKTLGWFSPFWKKLRSSVTDGVTSEGFLLEHVNQLGWMEAGSYVATAKEAVRTEVLEPLAEYGIVLGPRDIERLLDAA